MFYYFSKILWFFTVPSNLFLSAILAGVLLLSFTHRRKTGFVCIYLGVFACFLGGLAPVANWVLLPLEQRFQTFKGTQKTLTGIIVLGGAAMPEESFEREQLVLNEAGERVMALGHLARLYPEAKLVFSGGGGTVFRDHVSEAETVVRFADTIGVDPKRIIIEDKSRSTAENALFSKMLLSPTDDETWLLVTSAWHMPRAVGTFRKSGFKVLAYPVDYRTRGPRDVWRTFAFASEGLRRLDTGAKEWAGLIAYRLMGRTDALFPEAFDP